jgi:tetratricopeptide (TPR) repeat protein
MRSIKRGAGAALRLALVVSAFLSAGQLNAAAGASQQKPQSSPQPKAPSTAPPHKTGGAAAPRSAEFDRLVKAATDARKDQRWEDAIELYGKAVKLKPDYVEGYWYQGTAYYSLDDYAHGRDAFRKVVRLAPKNGAAHAFLGLCEFGLKEYDRSLQHLLQSRILGVGDTKELGSVARFHAAILMTRIEQYEQALETLGEFAGEGDDNPRVIEAMGFATLRMPVLPIEAPPERREMVMMAGRASYMMAARSPAAANAFEALVARYPETPNVHYAYGVYLLQEQPEKAIDQFKRELELQPAHPASLMQIAFDYLTLGNAQSALSWARQAVTAAPNAFATRKALGQALLETGDVEGAITELQKGISLAPDSPGLHFTLARAYQRAGRLDAAAREREEFMRLDRLARTQKSGPQSVGGRIQER